ncbi:GNAT family N-acetyltransferase [[Clostridium] dakarense]|uniref:GNAT family N-acetyltransferase n=1 Tax=Faecalimicrobium dakarense TaxID=1301100 RepID=UPI0004B6B086|nr:GNAT family N-acetyltransferase [[Clostridium] dakarense]
MNIITKDNIVLKTSDISELNDLNNIYGEVCEYFSFDKNHQITSPKDCITKGDLPPNGSKDNFEMLSIYDNNELIGFITLYKGFPSDEILYICFMYIASKNRCNGNGYSIVNSISSYFKDRNFKSIRISVSLKNWYGIRFWNKCGFSLLTMVDIEGSFSDDNYGCLELEKTL